VRAYTASDEEGLRILRLLKDWTSEGFLSETQHQAMGRDIECGLRRTNGFLRAVLFLFTLISAAAGTALFFAASHLGLGKTGQGILFLLFAAICYAGSEFAVYAGHLYRHGIEEALAVLSIAFLCIGLQSLLYSPYAPGESGMTYLVPGAGAVASFLIYRRFGFQYCFWLP
jgi:hypothetical protein